MESLFQFQFQVIIHNSRGTKGAIILATSHPHQAKREMNTSMHAVDGAHLPDSHAVQQPNPQTITTHNSLELPQ